MKRVAKSLPPQALLDYIGINPNSTWDQMSNDGLGNGLQAVHECREQAILDQKGLCAYCEQKISSKNPQRRRIEHFHPKSDDSGRHNWSLDWTNMLAVCDGGSASTQEERIINPLPENLSCDSHKNHVLQVGGLSTNCESYLINPLHIPAFPNIFKFNKATGRHTSY